MFFRKPKPVAQVRPEPTVEQIQAEAIHHLCSSIRALRALGEKGYLTGDYDKFLSNTLGSMKTVGFVQREERRQKSERRSEDRRRSA